MFAARWHLLDGWWNLDGRIRSRIMEAGEVEDDESRVHHSGLDLAIRKKLVGIGRPISCYQDRFRLSLESEMVNGRSLHICCGCLF
jgi:hypothetical protein